MLAAPVIGWAIGSIRHPRPGRRARSWTRSPRAHPPSGPRVPVLSVGRPRWSWDRSRPRTRARTRYQPLAGSTRSPPPRRRLRRRPLAPISSFALLLTPGSTDSRLGPSFAPLVGKRSPLDQSRLASLLEGQFDDIEVPRHYRRGEQLTSFAQHFGPEVARRDVSQRKHPDAGGKSHLCGLRRRRVTRLLGATCLVLAEGGLVDEQIGVRGRLDHGAGRRGITRDHQLAPGSGRAKHLLGPNHRAIGARDG